MLTNASAVARYLGASEVIAVHLLEAIAILLGEKRMEDLGRPVSPLVRPASSTALEVVPTVRVLVQSWFDRLGNDPLALLGPDDLAEFRTNLEQLPG